MRHPIPSAASRRRRAALLGALALAAIAAPSAQAQDIGTLDPKPLPALKNPGDPATPAKQLFGRRPTPAAMEAHSLGFYSRGCLAGGQAIPFDGEAWQVMRLSRNRNWGHPDLVAVMKDIALRGRREGVWPGLLIGDMSQPRGGPMLTGHASHQIGLDADIWLTPMPARTLTRQEREMTSAVDMVRPDRKDIDPKVWTKGQAAIIRIAAQNPRVERIFVNAAIKKALCRSTSAGDRGWMSKVRPYWGHNYHFHIRITCPAGETGCQTQPPPPQDDGCGAGLDWWFSDAVLHPKPPKKPAKPKPPLTMAELPAACRAVLAAP